MSKIDDLLHDFFKNLVDIEEAKQELLSAILLTKPEKNDCSECGDGIADEWEQNIRDLFTKEENE